MIEKIYKNKHMVTCDNAMNLTLSDIRKNVVLKLREVQ